MEDDGVDFFEKYGMAGARAVPTPPDAEARYEEGVPLVRSDEQEDWPTPPLELETTSGRVQTYSRPEDKGDAVKSNGNSTLDSDDSVSRPQPLDRKTTDQVLDSLHYPPHHETHDEPRVRDLEGKDADFAGDGVIRFAGTGNEMSEVHEKADKRANAEQSLDDDSVQNHSPLGTDTDQRPIDGYLQEATLGQVSDEGLFGAGFNEDAMGEGAGQDPDEVGAIDDDLAAMWKAALDDDDFLVDGETSVDHSFFEDDGAGFMGDHQDVLHEQPQPRDSTLLVSGHDDQDQGYSNDNTADARPQVPQQTGPNRYTPEMPGIPNYSSAPSSLSDHTWQSPYAAPTSMLQQRPRPGLPEKTQSFADQSKGGYTSPYDLPLDISRPKKRANLQQVLQGSSGRGMPVHAPPAPPPRSSSMYTSQPPVLSQTRLQSLPSHDLAAGLFPPQATDLMHPPSSSLSASDVNAVPSSLKPKSSTRSFFEELPITAKPRPQSGLGRNPQHQGRPSPTPPQASSFVQQQPTHSPPSQAYQLQAPERVNPYAIPPQAALNTPPIPGVASRYSPAPPAQSNALPSRARYATPPATAPPPSRVLPFQPRTSSPLAHHEKVYHQQSHPSGSMSETSGGTQSLHESLINSHTIPHKPLSFHEAEQEIERSVANVDEPARSHQKSPPDSSEGSDNHPVLDRGITNTPPSDSFPVPRLSPPKRATTAYTPQNQSILSDKEPVPAPPRRSQTQSPGKLLSSTRLPQTMQEPYQQPASVHEPTSSVHAMVPLAALPFQQPIHRQSISHLPNFISPADGREHDPLQRWKGCPVFAFGFGGTVVSSFPKHIPRYGAGQTTPMLKCSPGEVQLRSIKDIIPLEDHIAKFPGPLRSKGKKKDLLAWLDSLNAELEKDLPFVNQGTSLPDPRKRQEEKILLWKVLRALVEYDGVLEGNLNIDKITRSILTPEAEPDSEDAGRSYVTGMDLVGISRPGGSSVQSDPINPEVVESIRKLLIKGDRENAVWHAVDKRLWAHAMLISSTLSKDIWKQVGQEFVRQEVRLLGDNTESLAALYEIFAGNWEESIDELVPPSARAGLQMVSKVAGSGPTKNALDGLDRWRETLSLILSNRSAGDGQAILALGRLLSGYGRIEAAHICYLFARSSIIFGGSADPQTHMALIGADHVRQPFRDAADIDAILLSEIYEYSVSVSPSSPSSAVVPHLQGYKLYHALKLAEYGYRAEAQQYCDAIASALKMTTKLAPYYHTLLFSALDDLTKRLQQSPKDGSSSWISKPSMEKVSGSVWAKFNSFVAGDESDAHSTASGQGADSEVGPFAKVAGGTPTISRSPSNTELYGSYPGGNGGQPSVSAMTNTRYAPTGPYAPRTSLDQPGRSSHESQRSSPYEPAKASGQYHRDSYNPNSAFGNDFALQNQPPDYQHSPPSRRFSDTVQTSQNLYVHSPSSVQTSSSLYHQDTYQPTPPSLPTASFERYNSSPEAARPIESSEYMSSSYSPSAYYPVPSSRHEARADNAYEPPSYGRGYQNGEASPVHEKAKHRFTMDDDDDDDFSKKAADVLQHEKSRKDKEADEAFKRAAAEDAKKDTQAGDKKGWFGGWFGKKDPNAAPGPIKAKLGEESSFYYDPNLKKWVNKKGGAAASAPSAAPPPPKGPPSRAVSSPPTAIPPTVRPQQASTLAPRIPITASTSMPSIAALPPSGPPSGVGTPQRTDSPVESSNTLVPPSLAALALGPSSGPPSGPPSRPTTSMSNASSIDDLIGAPAARKGGTVKKSKKGRGYVDVMAK
ncbi:MAG: vesicle coat component [Pleopsidium flavum]|nr:MAG: vesicle coat component [Pleopsidium flavum]